MTSRVTQDEHGVVSVYDGDTLRMFLRRSDYDQIRQSLELPALEPEPVISGGSVLYGIPCTRGLHE